MTKHLIVGAVFLDDVDDVLDGAFACKKPERSKIHQAAILHGLLRIMRQRGAARQRNRADVSRNYRATVLPALFVFFFVARKHAVRWILRASTVVPTHRRAFASTPLPIPDDAC